MPKFSANISMLFTDLPFLDRFAAARSAGFEAVECWFPYEHSIGALQAALRQNDLVMVGINSAAGAATEWGIAALPGREADFERTAQQALDYGQNLGAAVHVMAGVIAGIAHEEAEAAYLGNLQRALRLSEGTGVQLLIEPLNGRDRAGYFLSRSDQAAEIIARPGFERLKLMFDCYHIAINEGDLITRLRRHLPITGHIQIAAVPSRHEPDEGEIAYGAVLAEIDRLGWQNWVGAEYRPRGDTVAGLAWRDALVR